MNDSSIQEFSLVQTFEISPIKVLSHKSNKVIKSSPNCTCLEVFDELFDKENSLNCKLSHKNDKKSSYKEFGRSDKLPSKQLKEKVIVPSRYKSDSNNGNKASTSSFKIIKNQQPMKTAPIFGTANKENKSIGNYKPQNVLSVRNRFNEMKLSKEKIVSQNSNTSKSIKSLSGIKEDDSKLNVSVNAKEERAKLQKSLDMTYCKYLQSLFLKNHYKNAFDVQETEFLANYHNLEKENRNLTNSLSVFKLFNDVDDKLKERKVLADILNDRLETVFLENIMKNLQLCSDLVEVDEKLDIGILKNSDLIIIRDNIREEIQVGDQLIVEDFSKLYSDFSETNNLIQAQFTEIESIKEESIDLAYKLLSNVSNKV